MLEFRTQRRRFFFEIISILALGNVVASSEEYLRVQGSKVAGPIIRGWSVAWSARGWHGWRVSHIAPSIDILSKSFIR